MRRTWWSRVLAGWFACWLPLVLADGGWLHACPMHDGMGMMSPATMMAGHTAHGASSGHHDRHPAGHSCTCVGACCAAMAVLPASPVLPTVTPVQHAVIAPTGRPAHEYVAAWVDFVLPFATAPPARG